MKSTRSAHKKFMYAGLLLSLGALSTPVQPACPPSLSWSLNYNSPENSDDVAYAVAVDVNGNVIVAGTEVKDLGGGPLNLGLVQKYDANKILLWSKSLTGAIVSPNSIRAVATDSSGNAIVAGYQTYLGVDHWLVVKYDQDGNTLWSDAQGLTAFISPAYGVAVDGSQNVIAVGAEMGVGGTNWRIRKYDSAGNTLWTKTYNGPGNLDDIAYGVAVDSGGNVIVVGNQRNGGNDYDWVIQKYAPNGGLIWQRTYDGPANGWDEAYAVAVDASDNIVVVGKEWTGFSPGERYNWLIRKYDGTGNLTWSRTDNGALNMDDKAYAVAIDACGNITVGGYFNGDASQSPPYDGGDWHTHQYDPDGNILCSFAHNGLGNGPDSVYGAAVDSNGDVILAGSETRTDLGQGINWLVQRHAGLSCAGPPPILIVEPPIVKPPITEPIDSGKVKIVGGIRGYLNPKRGERATILVRPAEAGEIRLRIYDENGTFVKEITAFTNGGRTEVLQWDGTDSSGADVRPGLYPILIQAPGIVYRDKLVVIH